MHLAAAFKAYDIRGLVPQQLDDHAAYWLGRGFAEITGAPSAVLGMDVRATSAALLAALAHGLADAGAEVFTLGLCCTEEIYFATAHFGHALGLMVTASHNPLEYNGIKPILADGAPFTAAPMGQLKDYVLAHLAAPSAQPSLAVASGASIADATAGARRVTPTELNHRPAYVRHILSCLDLPLLNTLKGTRILLNAGHGCAGPTVDALLPHLPFSAEKLHWQPDPTFPHGVPNPFLPTNRPATAQAVVAAGAAFGVAWDGDADRCFLFDETGAFVPPYYLLGLLAEALLPTAPGAKIVHDPRQYWDTQASIAAHGGTAAVSRVGHVFFKQKMRETGALLGGEVSAHFYFKSFFNCDSGMLPWLLVAQVMAKTGKPLSQLIAERRQTAPATDELNFVLSGISAAAILAHIQASFADATVETIDGLGLTDPADRWRANLRTSNTEPLLRLNLEARDPATLTRLQTRFIALLTAHGAQAAD